MLTLNRRVRVNVVTKNELQPLGPAEKTPNVLPVGSMTVVYMEKIRHSMITSSAAEITELCRKSRFPGKPTLLADPDPPFMLVLIVLEITQLRAPKRLTDSPLSLAISPTNGRVNVGTIITTMFTRTVLTTMTSSRRLALNFMDSIMVSTADTNITRRLARKTHPSGANCVSSSTMTKSSMTTHVEEVLHRSDVRVATILPAGMMLRVLADPSIRLLNGVKVEAMMAVLVFKTRQFTVVPRVFDMIRLVSCPSVTRLTVVTTLTRHVGIPSTLRSTKPSIRMIMPTDLPPLRHGPRLILYVGCNGECSSWCILLVLIQLCWRLRSLRRS